MPKVWCRINVTLHVPGERFAPVPGTAGLGFRDEQGVWHGDALPVVFGNADVGTVAPNTPVQLEEAEARSLIAKFGGEIIPRSDDGANRKVD